MNGHSFGKSAFYSADLSSVSSFLGVSLKGALSVRELSVGKLYINHDKHLLELYRGRPRIQQEEATGVVKLSNASTTPSFSADIEGERLHVAIDTGYNGSVVLPSEVYLSLGGSGVIENSSESGSVLTPGGEMVIRSGWFTRGKLMGRDLAGVSVTEGRRGLVGAEWLFGFNLEIDFIGREVRYVKRNLATGPVSPQLLLGAIFSYKDGVAKVEGIRQIDSAASEAGLEKGDVVVKLGSIAKGAFNMVAVDEEIASNAGKTIEIEFRRGSEDSLSKASLKLPEAISAWNFAGRKQVR